VVPGKTAETLPVLQAAVEATERLLELEGDDAATLARRARVELAPGQRLGQ